MSNDMKVKAASPWFGGKRTLAPTIVKFAGKHTQWFEPFVASAAVPFAKEPSQKETVGDLHGDMINLLWCVADPAEAPRLYERLQRAPFSEELLKEAVGRLEVERWAPDEYFDTPTDLSIDRAYWFMIASWMGRNGTAGTIRRDYQLAVRWTANGGSPTVRWRNAVDSMPAWHRRLLNMVILRRCAFTWIDRVEDVAGSVIYADPPYFIDGKTRTGCSSSGDNGRYVHEFSSASSSSPDLFGHSEPKNEHERLAEILSSYKNARVIVSYYDCDPIRKLYDGWNFHDFTMNKCLHMQAGRSRKKKKLDTIKKAPEVLITNFEVME